jgi:hypothetical protein
MTTLPGISPIFLNLSSTILTSYESEEKCRRQLFRVFLFCKFLPQTRRKRDGSKSTKKRRCRRLSDFIYSCFFVVSKLLLSQLMVKKKFSQHMQHPQAETLTQFFFSIEIASIC